MLTFYFYILLIILIVPHNIIYIFITVCVTSNMKISTSLLEVL